MATTLDFTGGVQRRYEKWPSSAVFQLYNRLDFARNNGGSGDTIQCLPIEAGILVTQVAHIVLTAEGGTSTGTIGDGTDPNGWIASANNNATAGTALMSDASGALTAGSVDFVRIAGGAAGDLTATGVAATDRIVAVIHWTAAGPTLADLTSEFTVAGADTINNDGGTNTTSDVLLVFYQTQSSFADDEAFGAVGGKYYSSADTIDMVLSANAVDTAVIGIMAMCMEVGF